MIKIDSLSSDDVCHILQYNVYENLQKDIKIGLNIMKPLNPLYSVLACSLLPFLINAQTFNGGSLDDALNWTPNTLPTTGPGSVTVNGQFDTTVTNRNWTVNQTGGTMTASSTDPVDFDGGSWSIDGATASWDIGRLDFTNFTVNVTNGGTFRSNADAGNAFLNAGSSITIDSTSQFFGSNNLNENLRFGGGAINVDGGSATQFSIRGGTGTINLDGGTVNLRRNRGTINLNLLSSGTFSVGDNRTLVQADWSAGSTATVTLDDDEWAESRWGSGQLFFEGDNNSTLGGGGLTWAQVTTAGGLDGIHSFSYDSGTETLTLVAIPEPSSIALLGIAGLAFYVFRRRSTPAR